MKKIIVIVVFAVILIAAVSSMASEALPAPRHCSICGDRNVTYMYTAVYPTNPPKIAYEVWRCGNGHYFNNYPAGTSSMDDYSPKTVYPEEIEGWSFYPMTQP